MTCWKPTEAVSCGAPVATCPWPPAACSVARSPQWAAQAAQAAGAQQRLGPRSAALIQGVEHMRFPQRGTPKMDGLCHGKSYRILMTWGYPHFRKPPHGDMAIKDGFS